MLSWKRLKDTLHVEETALSTTAPGRIYGKRVMTAEDNNGEMQEKAFNQCFV